ncbi:MAG: DUF6498-containing protein [Patescibacteria group bacterium]|nr:DUF6498-containing protein [Patescibacteria group bacterium]
MVSKNKFSLKLTKIIKKYYQGLISIFIANSIPLFGYLFFEWNIFEVLFYYLVETIVISIYFILKIIKRWRYENISFKEIFYQLHFFLIFMFIYFFFFFFFLFGWIAATKPSPSPDGFKNFLINQFFLPFIIYFFSHGISYKINFIDKEEYKLTKINLLVNNIWGRVIFIFLSSSIGVILTYGHNLNFLSFFSIFLIKTFFDFYFHLKERKISYPNF